MKRLLLLTLAISALYSAPQAFSQKILATIPIGGQPGYLAINTTTNMIYVPNQTLNTVTVINGNSNQVVANIPVGAYPYAAAVNPATNLVYVTLPISSPGPSVVVIDGATNIVAATIPVTIPPFGIAVNSTTGLIYFSSSSSTNSSVGVIEGTSNRIVATLSLSTSCCVTAVSVNTSTNRIYVADDFSSQQVVVIDGGTNNFKMFNVAGVCDLQYLAVDSVLNRIYAADSVCGGLYVIDGANDKLITSLLPKDSGPTAVNLANHQVVDFAVNVLSFVNGRTGTIVGGSINFPVGLGGLSIAAGNHNRYYASFNGAGSTGITVVSGPAQ
jgi:YVTN family beta-propeller protein